MKSLHTMAREDTDVLVSHFEHIHNYFLRPDCAVQSVRPWVPLPVSRPGSELCTRLQVELRERLAESEDRSTRHAWAHAEALQVSGQGLGLGVRSRPSAYASGYSAQTGGQCELSSPCGCSSGCDKLAQSTQS